MLILVETFIKDYDGYTDCDYALIEKDYFEANQMREKLMNKENSEGSEITDVYVSDIKFHEAVTLFTVKTGDANFDVDLNIDFDTTFDIMRENLTPELYEEFLANTYTDLDELTAKYPEKMELINSL